MCLFVLNIVHVLRNLLFLTYYGDINKTSNKNLDSAARRTLRSCSQATGGRANPWATKGGSLN